MTTNEIIRILGAIHNGAYFKAQWESELPLTAAAKKAGVSATKICSAVCRKGIEYSAQKAVKDKVSGGHLLMHELPWGNWKKDHEGLLIEHKGNDYIRLYLGPNKIETGYNLNGKIVDKEDLKKSGYIQNSWFTQKTEKPDCITVKVNNITKIGR